MNEDFIANYKSKLREQILSKKIENFHIKSANASQNLCSLLKTLNNNFLNNQNTQNIDYGFYYPMEGEVDISDTLEKVFKYHKSICLPKVKSLDLQFYKIIKESESLLENFLHTSRKFKKLKEPSIGTIVSPKIIVLHGLSFDSNGTRLGYGKGFYDRFLARQENYVAIGICFNENTLSKIPKSKVDIPVDYIVTDEGILTL